jgi:hypothetical protein
MSPFLCSTAPRLRPTGGFTSIELLGELLSDALTHESAASPKYGVSRRQLVKAGVWAAPAVAMAVATPAASASGTLALTISGASLAYAWGSGTLNGIDGSLTVTNQTNTGTGGTVEGISVVVSVDATGVALTAPADVTPNWTASTGTVSDGKASFTFTFAGTLASNQSQALIFTLGSNGLTSTTDRAWTAASSGTTPTPDTSVTGGSAGGTVSLVTASPTVAPPPSPQLTSTGSNGKDVVVSLSISANVSVVARLTVTPKHQNDDFLPPSAGSGYTIANGGTATADDVATSGSLSAGPATITFPTYQKQDSAASRSYTLEFLIDGMVYTPATRTGVL